MSEIELRFNPQLGTWYNPLTWYGKESSPAPQVQTKPAVDDFFAPGEEKKMDEQLIREKLIAEWRHNLMLAAAGAGFALVLILLFRKKK